MNSGAVVDDDGLVVMVNNTFCLGSLLYFCAVSVCATHSFSERRSFSCAVG